MLADALPMPKSVRAVGILVLYVLPPALIVLGLIPFDWWPATYYVTCAVILAVVSLQNRGPADLGFRLDNLASSLVGFGAYTLLALAITIPAIIVFGQPLITGQTHWLRLCAGSLLVSLLQEFAYRSVLLSELRTLLRSAAAAIVINATLYGFVHVVYSPLVMLLTFLVGLGWAFIYERRPNLIAVTLSHAVLNFVTVLYGFFA